MHHNEGLSTVRRKQVKNKSTIYKIKTHHHHQNHHPRTNDATNKPKDWTVANAQSDPESAFAKKDVFLRFTRFVVSLVKGFVKFKLTFLVFHTMFRPPLAFPLRT